MGIDLVVFSFATMDGFHIESMTQDEFNAFLAAKVGKPVPGEHAFNAHHELVTERRYCLEKGFWRAVNIAVQEHVPLRIQNTKEHFFRMKIDSAVMFVCFCVKSHG